MENDSLIRQALGDKYQILSVVGRGGMATVYKAVQNSLNRLVALKVIHNNLVHDDEFVSRFLREAHVCGQLNHPNIVTVYDYGSIGQIHYMSMEYLEGVTLREIIREKGPLSPDETIKYIRPIASALAYIHQRDFVHRDVKSSNIFICHDGRPVLMDFGIVYFNSRESLSQYGAVLGTPEYMSPEQAEGKLKVDGRTDLYSLGVIMFECLTGKLPFKSNNHLATLHQILTEPPSRVITQNPKVPEWLSEIVAACLIKDRSERISDCAVLIDALQNKKLPFLHNESFSVGRKEDTEKMSGRNKPPSSTSKLHLPRQKSGSPYMDKRPLWIAVFLLLFLIIVFLSILILNPQTFS